MSEQEIPIKISVTIHKIKLSAKFPCSISYQLEENQQISESSAPTKLNRGSCTPEETLTINSIFIKRQNCFQQKKLKLSFFLITKDSSVQNGEITIQVTQQNVGNIQKLESSIDKCADSKTLVTYSVEVKLIQIDESNIQDKLGINSQLKQNSNGDSSLIAFSSPKISDIMKPISAIKANSKSKNRSYEAARHKPFFSPRGINQSSSYNSKNLNRQIKNANNNYQRNNNKNIQNNSSRISDQHYNRLKQQIDYQIQQNATTREQLMNYQRHERQLHQIIQLSKDQIQHIKQKFHKNQLIMIQYQGQLQQRQKIIKEMQKQLQELQEKYLDQTMNNTSLTKKLHFKEQLYKEQNIRVTQKYNLSQQDKQNSLLQRSRLLENLQTIQREHQQSNKQKDIAHRQQKNQLNKKIQSLNLKIQNMNESIQLKGSQYNDLIFEKDRFQKNYKEIILELQLYQRKDKQNQSEIKKLNENNRNMIHQLSTLKKIQTDLNYSKKNNQNLTTQINNLKRQIQGFNRSSKSLSSKNIELQEQIYKKTQQYTHLQSKISTLSAQLSTLRKSQSNKTKQIQTSNQSNLQANKRAEQYKSRLQQLQISNQQLTTKITEIQNNQQRTRQNLQRQVHQNKNKIQKNKSLILQHSNLIKKFEGQIEEYSKKIKRKDEQIEKLHHEFNATKNQRMLLQNRESTLTNKQKELDLTINSKDQQIHQLRKLSEKQQLQIIEMQQKISSMQFKYTDLMGKQQNLNKYLTTTVAEKQRTINSVNEQLVQLDNTITSLQFDNKKLKEQLQHYRQCQLNARRQNSQSSTHIQQLERQIGELSIKLQNKQKQFVHNTGKLQQMEIQFENLKKEFGKFSGDSIASTTQFLKEIKNIYSGVKEKPNKKTQSIPSFPNQQLADLQATTTEQLKTIISQHLSSIKQLQEQSKNWQQNFAKQNQKLLTQIKNLQASLNIQKQKAKALQDDLSKITSQLKQSKNIIIGLQDQKKTLQKELNQVIEKNKKQLEQLRKQLSNTSSSSSGAIQSLKDQLVKVKNQLTTSTNSNKEQTKNIAELQRKITQANQVLKNKQLSFNAEVTKLTKQLSKSSDDNTKLKKLSDSQTQQLSQLNKKHNQLLKQNKTMRLQLQKQSRVTTSQLQQKIQKIRQLQQQIEQGNKNRQDYLQVKQQLKFLKNKIVKCQHSNIQMQKNAKAILQMYGSNPSIINKSHQINSNNFKKKLTSQLLRDIQKQMAQIKTKIMTKYSLNFDDDFNNYQHKDSRKDFNLGRSTKLVRKRSSTSSVNAGLLTPRSKNQHNGNQSSVGKPQNQREQVIYDFRLAQQKLEMVIKTYQSIIQ